MDRPSDSPPQLLLLVAGAKGAIGTTLAAAVAAMQENPQLVLPGLTTADKFLFLGDCPAVAMAGWDLSADDITGAIARHGVLPEGMWRPYASRLMQIPIFDAPDAALCCCRPGEAAAAGYSTMPRTLPGCPAGDGQPAAGDARHSPIRRVFRPSTNSSANRVQGSCRTWLT
jgi:hypothetical protein